jgi:glutaredoxin-related protein
LVSANLIDATTKDDLLAMTNSHQSWATYNAIYVDARLVGLARGAVA